MRFFTVLFCLLAFSTLINAQSFQLQSDTLLKKVNLNETINYISTYATNTTTVEKTLRWTQNRLFFGSKWSLSQVCDNILCYLPSIVTRTIKLGPGEATLLKLQIEHNGQDTCGYYTITVKEDGTSGVEETIHYFFNGAECSAMSSVRKIDNVETVKIFPNPSADYVQLSSNENVKNVSIYNSNGAVVKQIWDYNMGLISVKELPTGTYYMMFSFQNGKMGVSKLFKN